MPCDKCRDLELDEDCESCPGTTELLPENIIALDAWRLLKTAGGDRLKIADIMPVVEAGGGCLRDIDKILQVDRYTAWRQD